MAHYHKRYVKPAIPAVLALIAMIWLLNSFTVVRIREHSMTPTLHDGQWVLVLKGSDHVRPGDVAVFVNPTDDRLAVKRCISRGPFQLVVDHGWLVTPWGRWYLTGQQWERLTKRLPLTNDEFFMAGDNQFHSTDSRSYGSVSRSGIVGRVVWPLLEKPHA